MDPQAIVKKELTDVWMLHKLPRGCFKVPEQRARKVGLEGWERGTERPHVTAFALKGNRLAGQSLEETPTAGPRTTMARIQSLSRQEGCTTLPAWAREQGRQVSYGWKE